MTEPHFTMEYRADYYNRKTGNIITCFFKPGDSIDTIVKIGGYWTSKIKIYRVGQRKQVAEINT